VYVHVLLSAVYMCEGVKSDSDDEDEETATKRIIQQVVWLLLLTFHINSYGLQCDLMCILDLLTVVCLLLAVDGRESS